MRTGVKCHVLIDEVHYGVMRTYSTSRRYYVYILANTDRTKLYVGITNNVWRRRFEHRQGVGKGYAHEHKCFDVIFVEEFTLIEEALSREKQVKAYGRLKKIELAKVANPDLESLKSPSELKAEWIQLSTAERAERITRMGTSSHVDGEQ